MLDNERDNYCWEDRVKLSLSPVIFASIDIHIMRKDEATCQNNDPLILNTVRNKCDNQFSVIYIGHSYSISFYFIFHIRFNFSF